MSLLSNAKWNSFSQLTKILLQVVNLIYLAKIIPPEEYGLMAMTTVVISLGILLRDLGTAAAIIQKKNLTHQLKNTIFWVNTFMGVMIAIIISLSSPLIADVYRQPQLENVLIIISVIFPLSSCASVHLSLMERDSRFKRISFIEVSSSLTSVIVAIFLAKSGFGVYSLVGQAIILNLMSSIQFWIASTWRPTLSKMICIEEIKGIFSFSANLSIFNFVNYFSRNGDSFIIGRFMSTTVLGNYNLAYRIMLFPLQSLTFVASRSLYPILSQYQDDNKKILSTYNNSIFVIFMITAPLMTGLAILSVPFVNLVFGPNWTLVASILKFLAPTAIIQAILSTTGSVFSAKGRTDILLRLGILGTILQFGSFLIGVNYSITVFALCYLVANVLNFFPVMFVLLRLIDGSLFGFLKLISPVVISTLIMIGSMLIIDHNFYQLDKITSYPQLILVSLFSAAIYGFSLFCFSSKFRFFLHSNRA